LNIVSYGGGTNSTAMLIGMAQQDIPIDTILFADTGGEKPETYEYIEMFSHWLQRQGYPKITTVQYHDRDGQRLTLEDECLNSKSLPSLAYGYKKCSQKHKIAPQDKFMNHHPQAVQIWRDGGKVFKYVGYDAGESYRRDHAAIYDRLDKKYEKLYPLIDDWSWEREDCADVIRHAGLPQPEKSACFFCPATKKHEIFELKKRHPNLLQRALEIERNAAQNLYSIKGLGRSFAWHDLIYGQKNQMKMCGVFEEEPDTPCECYDG
jgi:hypothetical protein